MIRHCIFSSSIQVDCTFLYATSRVDDANDGSKQKSGCVFQKERQLTFFGVGLYFDSIVYKDKGEGNQGKYDEQPPIVSDKLRYKIGEAIAGAYKIEHIACHAFIGKLAIYHIDIIGGEAYYIRYIEQGNASGLLVESIISELEG